MGDIILINSKEPNYSVLKESFIRLSKRRWLNDEAVNSYISLINQEQRVTSVDSKLGHSATSHVQQNTFVFNSFFFTQLKTMRHAERATNQYNFKKLLKIVTKKNVNLRRCTNIVFPINIEKSHWLLIAMNMPTSTFYIIDSLLPSMSTQ